MFLLKTLIVSHYIQIPNCGHNNLFDLAPATSPTSCPTIFFFSCNTSSSLLISLYSQTLVHAVLLPGPPSYLFSWLVPPQTSCLKDLTTLFKRSPSYLSPAPHTQYPQLFSITALFLIFVSLSIN